MILHCKMGFITILNKTMSNVGNVFGFMLGTMAKHIQDHRFVHPRKGLELENTNGKGNKKQDEGLKFKQDEEIIYIYKPWKSFATIFQSLVFPILFHSKCLSSSI